MGDFRLPAAHDGKIVAFFSGSNTRNLAFDGGSFKSMRS